MKTAATSGRDLLERTLSTVLQSFTGGVRAILAVGKGLFARLRDAANSSSLVKGV
ncbi:hypothetical protein AB0I98_49670 [Streptomyces sp. NPDC050211]|uniref:hypothetical protein n=1 Tax=Streptomyces sp. NPDC050211 TaxID=3154932 RepID=UPI0034197797